jgi:hypothetical protein
MEPIFLTFVVLAFFFSKTKIDTAAYANGKEAPGVTKARLRHENGGGVFGKAGRPKGRGALRLVMASRWANACEAARQRGDHRAERRRDWYEQTKDAKDERWRTKMQHRLDRADERRGRWADRLAGIHPDEIRLRRNENAAWRENARRDADAAKRNPADDNAPGVDPTRDVPDDTGREIPDAVPDPAVNRAIKDQPRPGAKPGNRPARTKDVPAAEPVPEALVDDKPAPPGATAPATEGTTNVYMEAVTQLTRAADGVAAWRNALKTFGDGLEGKGWGQQVTGPIKDMDTELATLEGQYRDKAAQMKQQGDNGKAAYEQAPWVPNAEAALA